MYDLTIKNGRIYDGTGSPPTLESIAVKGQRIVAIGSISGSSAKEINAEGLAVCPGFIDLHSHSDLSFLLDCNAQSKLRQGVTLELAGNCGNSICAPLKAYAGQRLKERLIEYGADLTVKWQSTADYLDAVQNTGLPLNLAVLTGHNTIRNCVMGMDNHRPSRYELDQMKDLLRQCLDEGAMGFSTGLFYAPGSYSEQPEVLELAAVAAEQGKLYSSHLRDEGAQNIGLLAALREAVETGRKSGARVQISHVKCKGPDSWGKSAQVLEAMEQARATGVDIAGDQYPYTASSNALSGALFPGWALVGGREESLSRLQEPPRRRRLLTQIDKNLRQYGGADRVVFARVSAQRDLEGLNLRQASGHMGCPPAEAALRIYESGNSQVVVHAMSQEDVERIAQHQLICVASDGSSLATQGILSQGKPHPRNYGTFPRFIARFVREKNLVSLAEAVRRMTSLPASRLGLTSRGRIAPGFAADLVMFSPETIADTATYDSPHSYPRGIPHVMVNGDLVVEDGRFTGKKPGRVIRGFAD
jgi:N-acyl-D-amino-acid deacylase